MRRSTICLFCGTLVLRSFVPLRAQVPVPKKPTTAPSSTSVPRKIRKPDFPPHKEIVDGYTKVITTTDARSFYTIWKRVKDGQMYAELPRGYASQKHFFAMTIAAGERYAGLQEGDVSVY